MRLDIFLKLSRLIPRRTLAQEFCDKGLITVNGTQAKSSKEIKLGDEIAIRRKGVLTSVRVLDIPEKKQTSKAEAGTLFAIISTETLPGADPLA